MSRQGELEESGESARASTALVRALPDAPPDPAFAARVLRSARGELLASRSTWKRTERLFARVLVPAALLVCGAAWTYHMADVAEQVFVSHGH